MIRKSCIGLSVLMGILLLSSESHSAVCGTLLNPLLVTTTGVTFGNYTASNADNTANGSITAVCTVQLGATLPSFAVHLSAGGGTFATRKMNFLLNTLSYNLYTSNTYATVWGDGTSSTGIQSYNTSGNVATRVFTVYGKIPKDQYVPVGLYGDNITVSVVY